MLKEVHGRKKSQLVFGLIFGIIFGFLLDRGGVTRYEVIMNQLLLRDFTVLKILFTAILTGMLGLHIMKKMGYIKFHPKPCRFRANIIGGLIFGIGFGLLGYCPGTAAGAIGRGSLHALVGVGGILAGAGIFASVYNYLQDFLKRDSIGNVTIPELLKTNQWLIILIVFVIFIAVLFILETKGF